ILAPKKKIASGGPGSKAKSSGPNSSRSGTSTGRQLRYGHCPKCGIGILERRRNHPDGTGPDAGLWRLSCTRFHAEPPCRYYKAYKEDPAILWQRRQNELGKGPCPECKIGKLVERIKNPFDFTEKYAECSRKGEQGGGCNYRRLITKAKVETQKKEMESPKFDKPDQETGHSYQDAVNNSQGTANHNQDANGSSSIVGNDNNTMSLLNESKMDSKPSAAAFAEPTGEETEVPGTVNLLRSTTPVVSNKGKNKAKVMIDLTGDEDDEDEEYGPAGARYPSVSAVYPAQTRLFRSSGSERHTQGLQPPKVSVSPPPAGQESALAGLTHHGKMLVTPAKSPSTAGQLPFSGSNPRTTAIPGPAHTPTKPQGIAGPQYPAHGMMTPSTNRVGKILPMPPTVPQKRTRGDEEEEEYDELDSDIKSAMIELADKLDKPGTSSNSHAGNHVPSQFNKPVNKHPNQSGKPWNPYTGHKAIEHRAKRVKQDEFDEFDDEDDLDLIAMAEETERQFFGEKKV
ncbi:hypothetical protein QBC40DRAFT_326428, partial [Triangularia verruculosa]